MKFNRRARLDTSRIRDRRRMGGGVGGGRGMAVGGGLGGIAILLIAAFMGVDLTGLTGTESGGQAPAGGDLEQCATGADFEQNAQCRFVIVENSIAGFWEDEFERAGEQYEQATFTTFSGQVSTGCGSASSQVGPFYCPPDRGVYMDLDFFRTLETQLGARGGDFAEAYVVAHEYGHHVQNLTGQMDRVRTEQGADSDAVALELQADCYAGVWAASATKPVDGEEPLITEITRQDVAEAIDAAETVGDDYIQERMEGTVTPETWTHGSSEQRRTWFQRGMKTGSRAACDTFSD